MARVVGRSEKDGTRIHLRSAMEERGFQDFVQCHSLMKVNLK